MAEYPFLQGIPFGLQKLAFTVCCTNNAIDSSMVVK